MVKVKVTNNLKEGIVQVKEGNAGVFAIRGTIQPGASFTLSLDPNATYREYVLITLPNNTELDKFSSDDAQEYQEILVKEEKVNDKIQYSWEGVRRGERREPVLQRPDKESLTFGQNLKKFFGMNYK